MSWTHDPKSWFAFPVECLWYLLPDLNCPHILAWIASLGVILIFRMFRIHVIQYSTITLYHGCLLFSAMIANGIWSCAIWGSLYWSVDYVSDFSPLYPISEGLIRCTWGNDSGGLNGLTLTQLNRVWLAFTLGVWISSFLLTFWIFRRIRQKRIKSEVLPIQADSTVEIS